MTKEIFPQWVIVNGQIHRVSDFSHLPPVFRPEAICPLCMNPVILKLGSERVHHYAHRPDTVCAATQPETALHLNTKFYIYQQLLNGSKLYLEQRCSNGCGISRNVSWVEDWERVKIESEIGLFRPDITIVVSNETTKAIEVVVTHHVEDNTEAFYKTSSIGWIEVEACESIYEGENAWRIDQPLPFAICNPPLTEWTCDTCSEQLRKEEELKLREQREREYRQQNYDEIIYSKLVDYYFPSGKKYRETYLVVKYVRNNKPSGILVKTEKNVIVIEQIAENFEAVLQLAFNTTELKIITRYKPDTIIDNWEWLPWVYGKKYFARDIERYPIRYKWDEGVRKWLK
jgi:hypothetical protein